jgi:ATP-dependent RNA helicase RhlE
VAPDEEPELRGIEKAIGKRLPRVTVPDFNYAARPVGKLEVPAAQRMAEFRAKKAVERSRAAENTRRRGGSLPPRGHGGPPSHERGGRGGRGAGGR